MIFEKKCETCGEIIRVDYPDDTVRCLAEFGVPNPADMLRNCDGCLVKWEAKRREDYQRKQEMLIAQASGIPIERTQWDSEKGNNELLCFVKGYGDNSLFIADRYGEGKTWAVCHAASVLIFKNNGLVVKYWLVADLLATLSSLYGENMREAEKIVRELKECDLLILDDFGKEKITDRGGEALFRVLDSRYVSGKRTWITSNFNGNELSEKIGERGDAILRRLREKFFSWNHYKAGKLPEKRAPAKQEPREARKPYLETDYLENAPEEAGNTAEIDFEASAV